MYFKQESRQLLKLMIDAGFYQSPSQFLDSMVKEKALLYLPRVKDEQISAARAKVAELERVSTEWDRIEKEALDRKQKLAEIWNDILVSFKRIHKAPGRTDNPHIIAQNRIQEQNWLESRYLDDPDLRAALIEMYGTIDKQRLFEILVENLVTVPNFER